MLTAATTIVDNNERLRWLLIALAVAGAAAAAPAAVLLSPWWTHRQAQRAAAAEVAKAAVRVRQERERRREVDLHTHFEPLGRGVAQPDWRGQYFTGRTRVLQELVGWLSAPPGTTSRIRVVTGRPGSGKSAVLGRLVTLSDPAHRAKVPPGDASASTVPPEGCIDVSVHAHGKTIEQILAVIAEATGIHADSPDELLLALANRVARLAVVVDALDEAVRPDEVARLLLRPLARSEGGAGVRLLVGTRPHLVGLLGATPADILDLDDPGYFDRGDLAEYARRCLLAEGLATDDPQLPTPYLGHPELARRVAGAVAARAGTAFLVAQLASRALARDDTVVDLAEPGWRQRLPATVGAAMDDYLARLGAKEQPSREQELRDLLLPLAYAQGLGLPDEDLWAVLASATGTRRYEGHDVRWLLATGAVDLVQGGTTQEPAYRLFHEALAEHLRAQRQEQHDQRRYLRALLGRVPARPGDAGRDWSVADPYTRMHLAAHAAQAGLLDELLIDPGYLLAADPASLLSVLPAARALLARTAELVFQQAAPYLLAAPADDRAAYLEMAARRNHADGLAERLAKLQPQRPWSVAWTDWQAASPHRILGNHAGRVFGIAVAEHEGRRIVVSNGGDGYVRRWDLATGAPVGDPIASGDPCGPVRLGQLDGRAVVVGCTKRRDEAVVEVWDLVRGTPAREPIPLGGVASWAIESAEVNGRPLVVIGGEDGQLWVCDLHTGAVVWTARTRTHTPVWRVLIAELHHRPVVLTSRGDPDDGAEIWDLATGQRAAPPIEHSPLAVVPDNRQLVAVELGTAESSSGQVLGLWDLEAGRLLTEIPAGFAWYWRELRILTTAGAMLAVAGCTDGFVRVWDLNRARHIGAPLLGHDGVVTALAVTTLDGQPVAISGGRDGTIRVWQLDLDAPASASRDYSHASDPSERRPDVPRPDHRLGPRARPARRAPAHPGRPRGRATRPQPRPLARHQR